MLNKIDENTLARPFLRWAGGKQWLSNIVSEIVPDFGGSYYEPFLGGGALYFRLNPKKSYLSDLNPELINTYIQVRDNVEILINKLSNLKINKKTYYNIRDSKPTSEIQKAVRFLYLNRTCWNGLYRVNQKGEFNVPMGNNKYKSICDEDGLRNASSALKNSRIKAGDFESALKSAGKGDLIYIDPPYTAKKNLQSNGFIAYNSKLFSLADQERLAMKVKELSKKGSYIIVSNVDHPTIVKLYKDFFTKKIYRNSTIAGMVKDRKNISERLFANFPIYLNGE